MNKPIVSPLLLQGMVLGLICAPAVLAQTAKEKPALPTPNPAQLRPEKRKPEPRVLRAWEEFKRQHGEEWGVRWNDMSGLPERISRVRPDPTTMRRCVKQRWSSSTAIRSCFH